MNGSFVIFTETTNFSKCLDAQYESQEIIKDRVTRQSPYDKNKIKESQKWYFYPVETAFDKTIVTETEYTQSKNFVSAVTDQRGNKTSYSYDETQRARSAA